MQNSNLPGHPVFYLAILLQTQKLYFFFNLKKREREKERRNHRAVNVFGDGLIFRKNTVIHQIALQNISERSR